MTWIRIEAPHFVAAVCFDENGVCIKAAPILKWTVGKTFSYCFDYWKRKGFSLTEI
jgi:hypothetical protein